ncbi:hypothetical protein [Clostridium sp.]|nr:hypothetical protein [Clostridium sp.]
MSSNNKNNEIIDLLSEIIINHLLKSISIDETETVKNDEIN